jgi:hypothetical protein
MNELRQAASRAIDERSHLSERLRRRGDVRGSDEDALI